MSYSEGTETLTSALRTRLAETLRTGVDLPVLPGTAAEVLSLCEDQNCDASVLSELICRDQSLAGNVLKVSNSTVFAPRVPIESLRQAVSRLGTTTIREIAMAVALKGNVFRVPGHQTRIREMWIHSAAAGIYAKEIARHLRFDAEKAFLCGLLHDSGRPIVLKTILEVRDESGPMATALFDAAMDEFHAEVGGQLVRHWGMKDWLVEAVVHHHEPSRAKDPLFAQITGLADLMSHWALDEQTDPEDFPADDPIVVDMGLANAELNALLALRGRVLEVAEAFM